MTPENTNLTVLGVPLALKAGANTRRFQQAIQLVEERFADQIRRNNGRQNKELLLTFMALELADELLQLQKQHQDTGNRLEQLLSYIEQSK
ncbi:MAG: cell division protein ZapA [Desulfovibrionaceae bacterium]|nr:cell division protein ZapA [Desulfovibrionaceae bacterium]